MKIKKINNLNIKKQKIFSPFDIVIYLSILIGVFFLFFFFVILPPNKDSQGFKILVDGKTIACYTYSNSRFEVVDNDFNGKLVFDEQNNTLTVYLNQNLTDFNVIKIDNANKTAKVIEANCSSSHDCVYTPWLKENSAIVCAPHKLKIVTITSSPTPPTTGGVR